MMRAKSGCAGFITMFDSIRFTATLGARRTAVRASLTHASPNAWEAGISNQPADSSTTSSGISIRVSARGGSLRPPAWIRVFSHSVASFLLPHTRAEIPRIWLSRAAVWLAGGPSVLRAFPTQVRNQARTKLSRGQRRCRRNALENPGRGRYSTHELSKSCMYLIRCALRNLLATLCLLYT